MAAALPLLVHFPTPPCPAAAAEFLREPPRLPVPVFPAAPVLAPVPAAAEEEEEDAEEAVAVELMNCSDCMARGFKPMPARAKRSAKPFSLALRYACWASSAWSPKYAK